MLDSRDIKILDYILAEDDNLGLREIAKLINVSTRTVSRSIQSINTFFSTYNISISYSANKGFILENPNRLNIKDIYQDSVLNPQDDVSRIINHILAESDVTTYGLSELLFISNTTLFNRIEEAKIILNDFDLHFNIDVDKINIVGNESRIRELMHSISFNVNGPEIKGTYLESLGDSEFLSIKESIFNNLLEREIIISDLDFNNLLKSIIITLVRVEKNAYVDEVSRELVQTDSYRIIEQIISEILGSQLGLLTSNEIRYIAMTSGFIAYSFNKLNEIKTSDYVLIEKVLNQVAEETNQTFNVEDNFLQALASHVTTMVYRSRGGTQSANPMLGDIKLRYPAEMNDAIMFAKKIENIYSIAITEDEIGYLAVHLALLKKKTKKEKSIAIICNYGFGTSQILVEKINNGFDDINLLGIYPVHYLELVVAQTPDVIISTVELKNVLDIPVIVVDNLFAEDMNDNIRQILYSDEKEIKEISDLMSPDLFYKISGVNSISVIEEMFERLQITHLVPAVILDGIIERENISSTDIGNLVAIPHVFTSEVDSSYIVTAILESPITWGNEQVQLVLLIIFSEKDKAYASVFRKMYAQFKSIKQVNKLIESKDYKDFISNI